MEQRGARRLVLGTVQFGLPYGVSNDRGQVEPGAAKAILAAAAGAGVEAVDTAPAYGDSQNVLGGLLPQFPSLRVITKTRKLSEGGVDATLAEARRASELFPPGSLDAILVHSAADLSGHEGTRLWRGLEDLKAEGRVRRVGFSAYYEDDPVALARRFSPDILQAPLSLLDQRLSTTGALAELAALGVEVHVRSIFLQGLVFLDPARLPARLGPAGPKLKAAREAFAAACVSPVQACLAYALSCPGVARVVVGVTGLAELTEILEAVDRPTTGLPWRDFAIHEPEIVDPRRWASAT